MAEIKSDPTDPVEFILERFVYNYKSNTVHWKSMYSHDGCGALISSWKGGRGYLATRVCGKIVTMHKVVWILTTGKQPADGMELDHIDGNKQNNIHTNLREVNHSTNMHNCKRKGYYWNKQAHKWMAYIQVAGRQQNLGLFETEAEARAAYVAAKKLYGFIHR